MKYNMIYMILDREMKEKYPIVSTIADDLLTPPAITITSELASPRPE